MAEEHKTETKRFAIFRGADAPGLMEAGCMKIEPFTPEQREGMNKVVAAGYLEGDEVRLLCNIPGFSLIYVWLKAGYPLSRHSHDSDCLYYVIAGDLQFGNKTIGPRDSFFLPAGVAYTYTPGSAGVELLEFRHAANFNFLNMTHGSEFWTKAAESVAAHREAWKTAERPSSHALGSAAE